jgi:hypothetical protein
MLWAVFGYRSVIDTVIDKFIWGRWKNQEKREQLLLTSQDAAFHSLRRSRFWHQVLCSEVKRPIRLGSAWFHIRSGRTQCCEQNLILEHGCAKSAQNILL